MVACHAHKAVPGHHVQKRQFGNKCFGCGPENEIGLRLKFVLDEERQRFVCRFRLKGHFVGPPEHAHGGIIATILDEAMGKVNKLHNIVCLTSTMDVTYLKPVPLFKPLVVEGWEQRVRGREHYRSAEIRNQQGEVLATSKGKFIEIDPHAHVCEVSEEEAQRRDLTKSRTIVLLRSIRTVSRQRPSNCPIRSRRPTMRKPASSCK